MLTNAKSFSHVKTCSRSWTATRADTSASPATSLLRTRTPEHFLTIQSSLI
jgi:hypothetical protein